MIGPFLNGFAHPIDGFHQEPVSRRIEIAVAVRLASQDLSDGQVTNNHPILTGRIVLAHLKETLDYYVRLRVAEIEGDLLKACVSRNSEKLMSKYRLWLAARTELAERERSMAG